MVLSPIEAAPGADRVQMPRALINLTGQTFGRLTVVSRAENRENSARWNCICSCPDATRTVALSSNLRKGRTQSCGCGMREASQERSTRHGSARKGHVTPTYSTWVTMIQRCTNPNTKNWRRYGERGISVCERWQTFENFLADMGEKPPGKSIERVNNDLGYSPENCIWADQKTQQRNRSDTLHVTLCGERLSLAEACERHNVRRGYVLQHKSRHQTSAIEAFLYSLDR